MNRLTPIEEGDICCGCGEPIIEREYSICGTTFKAFRIDGHPFCVAPKCYSLKWDQYSNSRTECRCRIRPDSATDEYGARPAMEGK